MKKINWSKNRPVKPEVDPFMDDIVNRLSGDKRSQFQMADQSGLSPTTISNWMKGKVKRPQATSLVMAYRMLGFELRPVRVNIRKGDE
jgi:hypothetical protein